MSWLSEALEELLGHEISESEREATDAYQAVVDEQQGRGED